MRLARAAAGGRLEGGRGRGRSRREHVDGADPAAALEAGDVPRRDEGGRVLGVQHGFGGEAVRGQVRLERGLQEGAVDEEVEGDFSGGRGRP